MTSAPSFALPVFTDKNGNLFVQEVDDATGLVSDLIPTEIPTDELEPLKNQLVVGVGDKPIYCLLSSHGTIEVGRLSKLENSLNDIIADEAAPVGLRIQAAELVGSNSQKRRTRNLLGAALPNEASAIAYQRSATRTFLWRRLIAAARDANAAAEIKQVLSHLDVDIGRDGRVKLLLAEFDKSLCPSVDFSKLPAELEIELGFTTPSNDDDLPIRDRQEEDTDPITPERLMWFLNRRFGSDGRIARHTYNFLFDVVSRIGFTSTEQMERALRGVSSAKLCYAAYGNLQGQATRLELSLLAALGQTYIDRHPWGISEWFRANQERLLRKMASNGIEVGTFDIDADKANGGSAGTTDRTPPPFELEP